MKTKMTKKEIMQEILSYVKTIAISLLAAYIVCSKIVTQAQVPSGSMEDTIMTGSRVIMYRAAYWLEDPARGDIVAFRLPDDESQLLLKRIIGLPGETVEGIDGKVYINGEELEEPYIDTVYYGSFGPYVIPEDCYFMMGDNRGISWDSRFWNNKFVSKSAIQGKVKIELYPELKILE